MTLHTYYTAADGSRVYLEDCINSRVFYRIGESLTTATERFFSEKYKLLTT